MSLVNFATGTNTLVIHAAVEGCRRGLFTGIKSAGFPAPCLCSFDHSQTKKKRKKRERIRQPDTFPSEFKTKQNQAFGTQTSHCVFHLFKQQQKLPILST